MFSILIRLVVSTIVVMVADKTLKGFRVDTPTTAIIVAVVMGLLNTFIKPILQFLSFPITLLTLGLFYFVVNVAIVYICAYFVDGFSIKGFLAPLLFSLALSLTHWVTGWFLD